MADLTLETTVKHAARVFWQPVIEDVVMLDTEHGEYFGAQDTAARIWELLDSPITITAVCDRLIAQYDVDRATCETEVLAYAQQLLDAGLIEVVAGE